MSRDKSRLRMAAFSSSGVAAMAAALTGVSGQAVFAQQAEGVDRVVITGSRILRQDLVANSPIVTVDATTFENTTAIGVEQALNQLPQFVPALTEHNTTPLQATATSTPGASTVSLRGLGSHRTLTLIDGRRGMPVNATLSVDTNIIPSAAIERVEIISGGASAVYGADAVAGVVNFILKDDFEGFDFTTRYGMTEEGDGEQFQISALAGANLANGRGHVMLGMEHATRSPAYARNREWVRDRLVDPNVRGTEIPPLAGTYMQFGAGEQPSQALINTIFGPIPECTNPGNGTPCDRPRPTSYFWVNETPDGTGTIYTGAPGNGGVLNGQAGSFRYDGPLLDQATGLPFRKFNSDGALDQNNLDALTSLPMTRYSMFAKADYALNDSVNVTMQGNFSHNETRTVTSYAGAISNWSMWIPHGSRRENATITLADGSTVTGVTGDIWGASFVDPDAAFLGYTSSGGKVWDPTAMTNPDYLPGGALGLNPLGGSSALGVDPMTCGPVGGCVETYVFPMPLEVRALLADRRDVTGARSDALANDTARVQRTIDFAGRRGTVNKTNTYQMIFGVDGVLQNDWVWDISVSHGASETLTTYEGNPTYRALRAITESANYGVNFRQDGLNPNPSGTGRCATGLPIFRQFEISQDCYETLVADLKFTSEVIMNTGEANLAGDLFSLPAGDVGFAVGMGWREFEYESKVDEMNDAYTFAEEQVGQFAQESTSGQIGVFELYGELLVPVLSDLPFIQQFNLELGGRLSEYDTSGVVKTFKVLGDWSINDWARIRGGFNRATRAPHVGELFVGQTNGGASGAMADGDPCSQNNDLPTYGAGMGNPDPVNRDAVYQLCRDMMTGSGRYMFYDSIPLDQQPTRPGGGVIARQVNGMLYGNPNVEPETANTWTAGLVLSSPFDNPWADNLSLTVDWYSIEVKDIIAQQNATELWRQCILSLDANSDQCSVVERDLIGGGANLVWVSYSNEGYAKFTGVDVQLNWRAQFEDIGMGFIPGGLAVNSQLTVPLKRITQANAAADRVENVGTLRCDLGLNCSGYDYSVFTTFNYYVGDLSLSLRWNHYPTIEAATLATNPSTRDRGVFESYNLFSLSGSYRLNDTITLRGGVDNLFDTAPPLGGGSYAADGGWTGTTAPAFPTQPAFSNNATYDQLGRRFFIGASASF